MTSHTWHAGDFECDEPQEETSTLLRKSPSPLPQYRIRHRRRSHSCHPVVVMMLSVVLVAVMVVAVPSVLLPMFSGTTVATLVPGVYYEHLNDPNNNDEQDKANAAAPPPAVTNDTTLVQQNVTTEESAQAQEDATTTTEQDEKNNPGVAVPIPVSPLVVPMAPTTAAPSTTTAMDQQPPTAVTVITNPPPIMTHSPSHAPVPTYSPAPTYQDTPNQSDETFSHAAVRLLPQYYSQMVASLDILTPAVKPNQVYLARKAILKTRDLVDVFAPIYPNHYNLAETSTETATTTTTSSVEQADDNHHQEEENRRYDHHRHHHIHRHHHSREEEEENRHYDHRHRHHYEDHRLLSRHHHDDDKKKKDDHHDEHKHDHGSDKDIDPWWEFRHMLDIGYETVGNFLDLDHSHVKYTTSMLDKHRRLVLQWHEDWLAYVASHDMHALLQSPPFGRYKHKKESHLFWGATKESKRPKPDDSASACLRYLVQQQAEAAQKYLHVSLEFHSVLEEKRHEEYHNLRKILRSMVDEFEMMGELIDPFGIMAAELAVMKQARTRLGDMNDDYTAWTIYDENDWYHREKSHLDDSIHNQWLDFREWAVKEDGLKDSLRSMEKKLGHPSALIGLDEFLVSTRHRPTHQIVIGNEAGDADSIISAITLAYIESLGPSLEIKTPIVSVSRSALERQRPEVKLLLQLAKISSDSLICVDDHIMLQRDMSDYDVTLVDHNAVEQKFQTKDWTVREIVDHHVDQGLYRTTCDGPNRTIAFADGKPTVVSTCVLVFEHMQELFQPPYPAPVGLLLLGVILLDSMNLSTEARQVSLRDEDAVRGLLANVDWKDLSMDAKAKLNMTRTSKPDPTTLFNVLQAARYDSAFWDSLSVQEALDYDFKEYTYSSGSFGVSTILMPLTHFLAKPDLEGTILQFMTDIGTDFLGIMLAFESNGKQNRQLMLCGTRYFPMDDLVDFLVHDLYSKQPLGLTEITDVDYHSDDPDLTMRFFEQENVLSSRKQIGPILVQFFEEDWQG